MNEVKAWQCEFCNRVFLRHGNCGQHEHRCKNNPEKRHCITCVHGVMAEAEKVYQQLTVQSYMPGANSNEPDEYCGPYCAFHKIPISQKPYFIESDTCYVDSGFGEREEVPAPWTCEHYKYKGFAGWGKRKEAHDER